MARIELRHVTKQFGSVTAVNDLTMTINHREFVVLVGPSGCGKSTTLNLVAGLEEVTDGEIVINDRVVNNVQPMDRDLAMVFQDYALYPHMRVYDNLAFSLKLRRTPRREIESRIQEVSEMLGIRDLLRRRPKELSGGQRQRVALGRAIVRQPQAFLMDEPLSNLDAKLRVMMRIEIRRLHQRLETTTIYVTHDQVEAMTMGDRVVVMRDGIAQQIDRPEAIYRHPCNMFVAGFIGSPPMNFLTGQLAARNGAVYFEGKAARLRLADSTAQAVRVRVGERVVLGVRPSHVHPASWNQGRAAENVAVAALEAVDLIGDDCQVYLTCGDETLTAIFPADERPEPGRDVTIAFDVSHLHLFDAQSQETIA